MKKVSVLAVTVLLLGLVLFLVRCGSTLPAGEPANCGCSIPG